MKKNNVLLGLMCLLGAVSVTFTSLFIWKEVTTQKSKAVNYYIVNFDTDGGSFVKSQSVENGKNATKPNDPTKIIDDTIYTFNGWYNDEQEFNFDNTPITKDITLKAHWLSSPPGITHIVHLDPSGGTIEGSDILMVADGGTISNKPIISREGYDSSKVIWYTTSDYQEGSEFIFGKTVVYTNLFLHAKWGDIVTNTVHFMDGSTELSTQEVNYNCHASYYKPEDSVKVFDDWYNNKELTDTFDFKTKIVEETYIYAKWYVEPTKTYTVTWVDYNGDVLKTDDNVTEGTIPSYDKDPTKVPVREPDLTTDYEFANWAPAISEVHGDQTYVANYNVVKRYDSQVYMKINLTEESKTFGFNVTTSSSFNIDWGDGNISTYRESNYIEHTYGESGVYKIRAEGDVTEIKTRYNDSNRLLLKRVYLGSKISSLPADCFSGCSNLEFVEISDSVTSIGWFAFGGCSNLASITIPSGVTSISKYAFGNCSNLKSVTFAENSSLTSIGDAAFGDCTALTSIDIPNSVTSIGANVFAGCSSLVSIKLSTGLTSIASGAFDGCSSLTSITIPKSVTLIEIATGGIFNNCPNLETITVESGNTVYTSWDSSSGRDCNAVITIDGKTLIAGCKGTFIPNSVTTIGAWAFTGCSSLTSIELPDELSLIADFAFASCSGLTSIELPDKLSSIGNDAFSGCSGFTSINIPDSVTSIKTSAFSSCTNLTSIKFPSKLTSIAQGMVADCSSLTSITIPDSVTSIGRFAFSGCSNLASIIIPGNVISIDERAFEDCSSLTSIIIPASVKTLEKNLFSGCLNLETITVESGNTVYTSWDSSSGRDCNAVITIDGKTLIAGCKGTFIPNSVTTIGDYAFCNCLNLASIELPNNLMSINRSAFYGCSGLLSISIPDSVTSIGHSAFAYCSNLVSVNIPSGLTLIDQFSFCGCSSFTYIKIPNSVNEISWDAFRDCSKLEKVDLTAYDTTNEIPKLKNDAFSGCSSGLKFHVASEEMANKFMNSEKGWPTTLESYNWPQ